MTKEKFTETVLEAGLNSEEAERAWNSRPDYIDPDNLTEDEVRQAALLAILAREVGLNINELD